MADIKIVWFLVANKKKAKEFREIDEIPRGHLEFILSRGET